MYYSEDEDDDIVEDEADGDSNSSRVEACRPHRVHYTQCQLHCTLQPHWARVKPGSAERINFTNKHSWKQNFNI